MKYLLPCLSLIFLFTSSNGATYTVTNTGASGAGSLLDAIDNSNLNTGADTINFDIPGMPPHAIPLAVSATIMISDSVHIDGTSQPDNGYTGSCPKIVIDAAGVGPITILFQVASPGVYIYGLWVKNFADPGSFVFYVTSPGVTIGAPGKKNVFTNVGSSLAINNDNIQISSNYFGCNCDGTALDANTGNAIISYAPLNNVSITDNLISGNQVGIILGTLGTVSTNVIIKGNKVGTDITGTIALGNTFSGIGLTNITGLELGGPGINEGNLISGNGGEGCLLTVCSGTVFGNKIGTDITGNDTLPNDPLNTQYNTAFNCNGSSGITCTLNVGGMGSGEQNVFFGNDIAMNIADSSGHYVVANNIIGQTLSGLVSPLQGTGFQLYYDTNQVLLSDNFIYGTNAAIYATQCKRFSAQFNVLGLDINGNDLALSNGFSLSMVDSFNIQNSAIRNCAQGMIIIDCNDSYIGLNSIEECITPIAMRTSVSTCHHNLLVFNPIAYNTYSVNLNTGQVNAANDDILPPVIEGSNADSTWGSSLPDAIIDLCYDTTMIPDYPQGFIYHLRFNADATGHWAHHGFLDLPNHLTAMQTDLNNNSSGFSARLTLDIADASTNKFNLYPNPADAYFVLENISGKIFDSYQLLNTLGEAAAEGRIHDVSPTQIPVEDLAMGFYFLKVTSGKDFYMMKFLKQ